MPRRALLVGINDYKQISDLQGCVNDVINKRDLLKSQMGFRNEDIHVLIDSRATKANILDRLKWMIGNTKKSGDIVVFHFSGHGSQVRDRNGDELNDHMDELLCPYDMNWDGCFILDDDLEAIFKEVPSDVMLEVFLDCCHSGTATRSIGISKSSDVEHPIIPRYLPPPMDILCRHDGEEETLKQKKGFTSAQRSTARHIIWAGCKDDQTSADAYIDGTYHGAFTYYYCKHMREVNGNISRQVLLERVRDSLRHNDYTQIPQLECGDRSAYNMRSLQFVDMKEDERLLFLTKPYMQGDDVKKVQAALAKQGFDIETDGVFGPYTRVVVMKYQTNKGLLVDGIVGPRVRGVLFG